MADGLNEEFLAEAGVMEGKKDTDIGEISKQKISYFISPSERNFNLRTKVVRKRDSILSPLESAIDMMTGRVAQLKAELAKNPPRINSLQQVLQGRYVEVDEFKKSYFYFLKNFYFF